MQRKLPLMINDGGELSDPNLERSKTILITGASGKVARKLRQHFAAVGYIMRLIDRRSERGIDYHQILKADLSVYDETWASQFIGVEAVVHLAADSECTRVMGVHLSEQCRRNRKCDACCAFGGGPAHDICKQQLGYDRVSI
jgi:hypothetical protein